MKRIVIVAVAALLWGMVTGCGPGGSGSQYSTAQAPGSNATARQVGVNIASGDGQTGIIGSGLANPLTVVVIDQDGNPSAGNNVQFTLKAGSGILSATTIRTGADGKASVNLTLVGDLTPVQVQAAVSGSGSVIFKETPRLPVLGEVVDGILAGESVAFFPAILAIINGQDVVVLFKGTDPAIDTDFLPKAGELLGGLIKGVPAEEYPVMFIPIATLTGAPTGAQPPPTGSALKTQFGAASSGGDLPVVTNLLVNGDGAAVGIIGDATGIASGTLGALIDADAKVTVGGATTPVANLPVYLVRAADFPNDPAADKYSYFTVSASKIPFFDATEAISGTSAVGAIPVSSVVLPAASASLVNLTNGIAVRGLLLYNAPALADSAVPEAKLLPLPPEFINAFNVIQDKIVPLMDASRPANDKIRADLQAIGQIIKDNQNLINSLMNGQNADLMAMLPLANKILPKIDDIIRNTLSLLPNIKQQLTIVKNDLLPAIAEGLPADGGAFGGYSDGQPSTIRDTVIPFVKAEIDNLLAAMPTVQKLLQDLDALIPNDGNTITLVFNLVSGKLDTVLDDVTGLVHCFASGLQIFADQGIPILYDILEEAEHNFLPGQSPLSGMPGFQSMVAAIEAAYPPDTTLGDLPGFAQIEPMILHLLPPEWGNPADVSLFGTVIPAIGSVDIGADILPIIRHGLDGLDNALPGIIDALKNFTGFDFNLQLPF